MLEAARCRITDRTNEWRWLARRPLIRSTLLLRIVALETRSASGARVDGESSTDESSPESSMSSDEASEDVDDGTAGPSPVQEAEGSVVSSLSEDSVNENDSEQGGDVGTPQSAVASRPASALITGRVTFQVGGAGASSGPSGLAGEMSRRRNKGAEAGLSAAQKLAAADQDWASRQTILSVRSTMSRAGVRAADGSLPDGEAVYVERPQEQRGQLDSITAELLQGALSSWGYSDVVPNAAAQLGSGFFCGGHVLLVGADTQVGVLQYYCFDD